MRRIERTAGCMNLLYGMVFGLLLASVAWAAGRMGLTAPQGSNDLHGAYRAFGQGKLDESIQLARRTWEQQPENIDALFLLVRALIYRSYDDYDTGADRQTALALTDDALETLIGDTDALSIHAYALQATGDYREAIRVARRVLNRDDDNSVARLAMGLAYGRAGSYQVALRENQTALNTLPPDSDWLLDAQRALAISLGDLGRYEEAIEIVEAAIDLNDNLPVLYYERALYASQLGDADLATASYFRVLAFDPDNVKARLRMCELSSLIRESDRALQYCQEVTERAPDWPVGWYRLGREYYLRGDFPNAQRHLNRCSTLYVVQGTPIPQRQFECWYLQGQVAEILGDCDGLMAVYQEFQAMDALADIPQTWTYPPEGPPICTAATNMP